MNICDLFDQYRDEELSTADRSAFESHLALCQDCQAKKSLLDNVVHLIRSEEVRPLNLADQIARKAFQPKSTWASDVISWLRPVPALAALAMVVIVFSSLWIITGSGQVSAYSQYESLIEETDTGHVGALSQSAVSQARSENELELWLEQEGNSQ